MSTGNLSLLWANCVEVCKDRINNRSFWEALEKTVPVTIEGDLLVIGLDSMDFGRVTVVQQPINYSVVQQAVLERFGKPYQVKFIEGVTLEDWESMKVREEAANRLKMQGGMPAPGIASGVIPESWDSLGEQITRLYGQTPMRSLPQGKARFLNEALYILADALEILRPNDNDETAERGLARSIERVANIIETPSAIVAFELERLLAYRDAQAGE